MDAIPTKVVIDYEVDELDSFKALIRHIKNLLRHYNDDVYIETIAYGPGIKLLLNKDQEICEGLQGLNEAGVKFLACQNTLDSLGLNKDSLCSFAEVTSSGLGHILDRQKQDWLYYKAL